MPKLRVGIVGFAHMHIGDLVTPFLQLPDEFEFVAAADTPWKTEPMSSQPGCRKNVFPAVVQRCRIENTFEDWRRVLDLTPDLILLTSENSRHAEIACEAMRRGAHVILEKPMATRYADAALMANTSRETGRRLVINWPTAWSAPIRTAQRVYAEGVVGRALRFHYRNSESLGPFSYGQSLSGEEKASEWWYDASLGGGAFWDYLGYGSCLARCFLGKRALSAFAQKGNFLAPFRPDADDYAAAMQLFPDAVGHLEGSWATVSAGDIPSGPVVFGEKGTLVLRDGQILVYTERHCPDPSDVIDPDPLPEGRETLAKEFLHLLRAGGEPYDALSLPVNLDAMAALDACLRSCQSGQLEPVEQS